MMNETALNARFAQSDDTNTNTTTSAPPAAPSRRPNAPDFAALTDLTAPPDTPDTPPPSDPAAALAEALIASGALDAHIERIVRRVLAEYDAQQNVYTRRAGGYRPGAFGSIG